MFLKLDDTMYLNAFHIESIGKDTIDPESGWIILTTRAGHRFSVSAAQVHRIESELIKLRSEYPAAGGIPWSVEYDTGEHRIQVDAVLHVSVLNEDDKEPKLVLGMPTGKEYFGELPPGDHFSKRLEQVVNLLNEDVVDALKLANPPTRKAGPVLR